MRKHCGNCANHRKETNQFSEECGKCVIAVLENGERTDPSHWREKQQTNADRIRAMSDEEIAKLLDYEIGCPVTGDCEKMHRDCNACWLDWLQQPAE